MALAADAPEQCSLGWADFDATNVQTHGRSQERGGPRKSMAYQRGARQTNYEHGRRIRSTADHAGARQKTHGAR
eukprot:9474901-Pyramimonas_sp.AAC.1